MGSWEERRLGGVGEAGDEDVAALDQPDPVARRDAGDFLGDLRDPRPGGVDEGAGAEDAAQAGAPVFAGDRPQAALAPRLEARRAGQDWPPVAGGLPGAEHAPPPA